jgi:hypothetical protein
VALSQTVPLTLTVNAVPTPRPPVLRPPQPPTVSVIQRARGGLKAIGLSFGEALDPASADNRGFYRVRGAVRTNGKVVFARKLAVKSVVYSPTTETVRDHRAGTTLQAPSPDQYPGRLDRSEWLAQLESAFDRSEVIHRFAGPTFNLGAARGMGGPRYQFIFRSRPKYELIPASSLRPSVQAESLFRHPAHRIYHCGRWLSDVSHLRGAPSRFLARPSCGARRCRRTDAGNGIGGADVRDTSLTTGGVRRSGVFGRICR